MTDPQHTVTVPADGGPITRGDGSTVVDKDRVDRDRAARTATHPPLPGLFWNPRYNLSGELVEWTLTVDRDWYDALAPRAPLAQVGRPTDEQLGQLAYRIWMRHAPAALADNPAPWLTLPAEFREILTAIGVGVWQQGENRGYTVALDATLPSGRLGAASELDNIGDEVLVLARDFDGGTPELVGRIVDRLKGRAAELRRSTKREHQR